jgi:O-antigen ligase
MSTAEQHSRPLTPSWFESALFLLLMTGPPKFRGRDPFASLQGAIDSVVLVHVGIWTLGGLWVLARLYSSLLRRGVIPTLDATQVAGALLIAGLSLSVWDSPGFLLTVFTLGQFGVMLGFAWMFTHRFGASSCLQHLFAGVVALVVVMAGTFYFAPELVGDDVRFRGDYVADAGIVAVIGLVFCLSSVPQMRAPVFWTFVAIFGILLAISRTRSAYVAFLIFLAFGFVYGKRLPVRKLVAPIALVAFGVLMMDALASTTEFVIREQETVSTLSDRLPLWQHLTTVVMRDSPLMGLGYYSASRLVATEFNPGLGNAHSAFFEALVGGGLVGAALYIALAVCLVFSAIRLLQATGGQRQTVAAVGLLCIALPFSLITSVGLLAGPLGFAYWSLTALLPAIRREADRAAVAGQRVRSLQPAVARRVLPVHRRTATGAADTGP